MTAIIKYCEYELIPCDQSTVYMRNLARYGKEVADFYTYELECELGGDP